MSLENLTPKTRLELFLSKIAGEDTDLPEVKTRLEYWLKEIGEGGGGSGGGSNPIITCHANEALTQLILDITCQELLDMIKAGKIPILHGASHEDAYNIFLQYTPAEEEYEIPHTFEFAKYAQFYANELTDYPATSTEK